MKHSQTGIAKKFLFLVVGLLCAIGASAQSITVSGVVTDPEGEPLIGASILVEGTSTGTATNIDGEFTVSCSPNATLVVSYVGMQTQRVPVADRTTVNVQMSDGGVQLNEVVAIGYGAVKKSDATGSVAVIKPDDIEAGLATSTQDLLVGASPGLVVTTNGGNPTGGATIRIRGGSSLSANNNPLIVIDGVPQTDQSSAGGTNALTMINPSNIESMTVLKDASATAIYGSRASNGVIIITTKKGSAGKPQVNFSANWHVNTARKTIDVMNAAQFKQTLIDNGFGESTQAQFGDADTDWQKEVLRTSFSHDYNLSVGGTAGVLPYRVSVSYTNNQGILKTSGMERVTAGFNLSPKFFNGLLQVNANVQGTYVNSREADASAMTNAIAWNPTLPVYGALGQIPFTRFNTTGSTGRQMWNGYTAIVQTNGTPELNASNNPVAVLNEQNQTGKVYSSTGNLQIDYALHFLPELHFNLNLGYQVSKNDWNTTVDPGSIMAWRNNNLRLTAEGGATGAGTLYKKHEIQQNTLLDFYINYKKEFEAIKSNLDVMAGYSWQYFNYFGNENTFVNSRGFTYSYSNGTYNLEPAAADLTGTEVKNSKTSWSGPLQLLSFFGRLNYIFDDTYLLTFTLRDDASSRFSKENRWGLFPSLALGWKINNLPGLRDSEVLNEWKLRLGWGQTGQQDINSLFPYMAVYTLSNSGNALYPAYRPGSNDFSDINNWIEPLYPNPYDSNIKWETTTTWNVGMDLAFLNNRITANIDWYLRDTKDLLASTPVAQYNTGNYVTHNIGSLRNTGVELTIGAKPVVTPDFVWNTSFNVAYNRSKITKLTGDADNSLISARDYPGVSGGNSLQWFMEGETPYIFRVFQQVYDDNGDPIFGQYVDQNADGVIDDADLIKFHSPTAPWTMTWNNNFNYKRWDFGFTLRANFGNYVYNNVQRNRSQLTSVDSYGLNNLMVGVPLVPADANSSQLALSDYFVQNAGFIRCDNITLGYTFPELLRNQLNLRLFAACQNPFVLTKYKGIDPEIYEGIDNNVYPRPVTFTLGLVATF